MDALRAEMNKLNSQLVECVSVFGPGIGAVTLSEADDTFELVFSLEHAQFHCNRKVTVDYLGAQLKLEVTLYQDEDIIDMQKLKIDRLMPYINNWFKEFQKATNAVIHYLDEYTATYPAFLFLAGTSKLNFKVYYNQVPVIYHDEFYDITVQQNNTIDCSDVRGTIIIRDVIDGHQGDLTYTFQSIDELALVFDGRGNEISQTSPPSNITQCWHAMEKICTLLEKTALSDR